METAAPDRPAAAPPRPAPPAGTFAGLLAKELRGYFDGPTAYVVAVVFLLITGYFFGSSLFLANTASLSAFSDTAPLLLVFFVPAVTMRLVSEELKSGTLELLATLPVRDHEIVLSKYAAALGVLAFTLAATAPYAATIVILGRADWGAAAGTYAGLFLTGAVLAAAGLFASTLTRNQIVAFIVGFLLSFALFILGQLGPLVPPALSPLTDFLGLQSHLDNMARGILDSRDILYYGGLSGYFLFLAHLRLTARLR